MTADHVCERYAARLTQAGCVAYQQHDPLACAKCQHSGNYASSGKGWRVNRRPKQKAKYIAEAQQRSETMSKNGVCVECKREITIVARDMCSKCWKAWKKAQAGKQWAADVTAPLPSAAETPAAASNPVLVPRLQPAAEAPVAWVQPEQLTVTFDGQRDVELYRWLLGVARDERRSAVDQVLWMIEMSREAATCGA